jgi:hypothetical protein
MHYGIDKDLSDTLKIWEKIAADADETIQPLWLILAPLIGTQTASDAKILRLDDFEIVKCNDIEIARS